MYYELEIVEDLIVTELNPEFETSSVYKGNLEMILNFVQQEHIRIKNVIAQSIILEADELAKGHYVRRHQAGIIGVLDKLLSIIEYTEKLLESPDLNVPKELLGVQKVIYLMLEDVLHFLINRYAKYCDFHLIIPNKSKLTFIKECKSKIDIIERECKNETQDLLKLGFFPLIKLMNEEKISISYNEMNFYRELLRILYHSIQNKSFEKRDLFKALVFINFNSIYLLKYCTQIITEKTELLETLCEKLQFLLWCKKMVSQTYMQKEFALFPNKPSIKELISHWLDQEIYYLEELNKIKSIDYKERNKDGACLKVSTDLSVSQIACFVRLFVETGIFINPNKEEILRFIPSAYQSKRMGEFAYGSFRSKYYGIQESIKEDVREKIIEMLNQLKKL